MVRYKAANELLRVFMRDGTWAFALIFGGFFSFGFSGARLMD